MESDRGRSRTCRGGEVDDDVGGAASTSSMMRLSSKSAGARAVRRCPGSRDQIVDAEHMMTLSRSWAQTSLPMESGAACHDGPHVTASMMGFRVGRPCHVRAGPAAATHRDRGCFGRRHETAPRITSATRRIGTSRLLPVRRTDQGVRSVAASSDELTMADATGGGGRPWDRPDRNTDTWVPSFKRRSDDDNAGESRMSSLTPLKVAPQPPIRVPSSAPRSLRDGG